MKITRNIITSVFAGSVAGIVTGYIVGRQNKNTTAKKEKNAIASQSPLANTNEAPEDVHFFV